MNNKSKKLKNCKLLEPEVFKDSRGSIQSFYPKDSIVEYNLMITKKGDERGYHYHPHFDEYMIVVDGKCMFREYSDIFAEIELNIGDSVYIPANTSHSFLAVTDFKFVSLLTKRWHDSKPSIVKIDKKGKPLN